MNDRNQTGASELSTRRRPRRSRLHRIVVATAAIFASTLSFAPVFADDIVMKDGTKYLDVDVVRKKGDKWTLETVEGRSRRIKASEIATHEVKTSTRSEFETRLATLEKKDLPGMIALAKWALDRNARAMATKLLGKVIRIDRHNTEARKLLGHELVDGKWLKGRALEKYKAKQEAERYRARGFVQVKGEWVDPFTAKCLKAGLELHDDEWRTPDTIARMKKGLIRADDGRWYNAEEQKKLAQGMRKVGKKWKSITKLNEKRRESNGDDPWVLQSDHFIVAGLLSHAVLKKTLDDIESMWKPMLELFGDAPVAVLPKNKLRVVFVKDIDAYRGVSNSVRNERAAHTSSNHGVFLNPRDNTAYTYYFDTTFRGQWSRHGACHAFLAGLDSWEDLRSPMVEAFGAYFESFRGGKYKPGDVELRQLLADGVKLGKPRSEFSRFDVTDREKAYYRLGFVMHYMLEKHRDAVDDWMPGFIRGESNYHQLMDVVEAQAQKDGVELEKNLTAFFDEFRKGFQRR